MFLYKTYSQSADKKPKHVFHVTLHETLPQLFTVCSALYNEAIYSTADLPVKVSSHPWANYIMYMHTAGLKLTSNSLTVCFFPQTVCSAFWEHISSRLKNQVIPNLKSPTLKRYSHRESSNGNHAVEEMAIRLLHGKDGGLTCT